jgi:hypothetical protein
MRTHAARRQAEKPEDPRERSEQRGINRSDAAGRSGSLAVGNPAIHDLQSGPEALRPRFTASLPNERERVCSHDGWIESADPVAVRLRLAVDKPMDGKTISKRIRANLTT